MGKRQPVGKPATGCISYLDSIGVVCLYIGGHREYFAYSTYGSKEKAYKVAEVRMAVIEATTPELFEQHLRKDNKTGVAGVSTYQNRDGYTVYVASWPEGNRKSFMAGHKYSPETAFLLAVKARAAGIGVTPESLLEKTEHAVLIPLLSGYLGRVKTKTTQAMQEMINEKLDSYPWVDSEIVKATLATVKKLIGELDLSTIGRASHRKARPPASPAMIESRSAKIRAATSSPVSINGVIYASINDAARTLGIGRTTIGVRLRSENPDFAKWFYIKKE